jgi:glutathione S-transferase
MITLYGHPGSTCTRKVLCTLHETNTPFEMVVIDFAKGEHKAPPHLARQPFGRVPAIEEDGFEMYESRAIARYVNDSTGGQLVPTDVLARARMDQWANVEASYFSPAAMKPIYQYIFKRPQDDAVMAAAAKDLDVALDVADARLAQAPYFAGDHFSLADIFYLPYVEYLMLSPVKEAITKRSSFARWWKRCSERPAWKKTAGR